MLRNKIPKTELAFTFASTKNNGVTTLINYGYDASGNRISKVVAVGSTTTNTMYVRDASGNVMSIYTQDAAINAGAFTQTEISMYGSSRLGVWNVNRNVGGITHIDYSGYRGSFTRGNKLFELSNHLGNVLVTISDKKIGVDNGTYGEICPPCAPPPPDMPANPNCVCYPFLQSIMLDGIIDYYFADVITANDYYPFGMQQPGRKYSIGSSYRYGFNGKENDNEVKGEGNQQDYGMRIYDPRIGKFLTVDPLQKQFPFYTPYQFSGNNPVKFIDLDGREPVSPAAELESIRLIHNLEKGNIVSGYFNPNDRLNNMDVKKVYDPAKQKAYFISDLNGSQVFWKTEENTLRVHRKADGSVMANGSWEIYESYEQRKARIGGNIASGFGIGLFGIVARVAAAPVLSALGGAPLIGSGAVSAPTWGAVGRGTAGAIGDAAGQLATNGGDFRSLNRYSIGANFLGGVFGVNSFTTEAAASLLGRMVH